MNLSNALAKPSSALEAVTRRAARCTWTLALPIAMLSQECPEHQHVVCRVADRGDGFRQDPVPCGQVAGDRALVGLRVGNVEVIGLGQAADT